MVILPVAAPLARLRRRLRSEKPFRKHFRTPGQCRPGPLYGAHRSTTLKPHPFRVRLESLAAVLASDATRRLPRQWPELGTSASPPDPAFSFPPRHNRGTLGRAFPPDGEGSLRCDDHFRFANLTRLVSAQDAHTGTGQRRDAFQERRASAAYATPLCAHAGASTFLGRGRRP